MENINENTRVYAKIDLDIIKENLKNLKKNTPANTKIIAVVKANAYGHGAVAVAKAVENLDFIYGFAVASGNEALELVLNGIKKPVLILGGVFKEELAELILHEIRLTLYSSLVAKMICDTCREIGKKAYVHVKIDTGMGRIGYPANASGISDIMSDLNNEYIVPEGIFTHFSRADEEDKKYTHLQIEMFNEVVNTLSDARINFKYHHSANSAGIIDLLGNGNELVRAGIAMYGVYPSEDVSKELVPLKNALSLYTRIIHIKEVLPGTAISYGGTFVSYEKMRIATISIGYGDGYPRSLSNRGEVIVRGKKTRIIGRVCMDQLMIDVTNIPEAEFGDEVTLIGGNGAVNITIDDVARAGGVFNYELMCDFTPRVKRMYVGNEG